MKIEIILMVISYVSIIGGVVFFGSSLFYKGKRSGTFNHSVDYVRPIPLITDTNDMVAVTVISKEKEEIKLRGEIALNKVLYKISRDELIDKVSNSAKIPKRSSNKAVRTVVETLSTALAEGKGVELTGFEVKKNRARGRRGRNLHNTKGIKIVGVDMPVLELGENKDATRNQNLE